MNSKPELTINPAHLGKSVNSFFNTIVNKKWLNGGKTETWKRVEKIVGVWQKEAGQYFDKPIPTKVKRISTVKNLIPSWKDSRLKLSFESTYYHDLLPDISSFNIVEEPSANVPDNYKQLAVRAIQLLTLARSIEINSNKDGLMKLEFEVAENGGWIIGFNSTNVLVYFPLPAERMMDKLLAEEK